MNIQSTFAMAALVFAAAACASIDHAALSQARIKCDRQNPEWKTSAKAYLSCVQEKKYSETENKQDKPLLNMERGTRAFAKSNIKLAKRMFENTAKAVETIYGNSPEAQKARSAFRQESDKLFIGETHERAMVFHYLGLIDLAQGNYQNARASFRASVLQDSLAANEVFRQDFASSAWLAGWAAHCAGSARSKKSFAQAQKFMPTKNPARGDNLLVVAELGEGPFKLTSGQYGEKLIYAAHNKTPIQLSWRPKRFGLFQANDLDFQAITRGDRTFDEYLKAQSESKKTAKQVGDVALGVGLVALDLASQVDNATAQGVLAAVGVGALAIGVVSHGVGAAINPIADTRTWRTLPHKIYIGSFNVPAQARTLKSLKGHDRSLTRFINWAENNDRQIASVVAGKGQCRLLWLRDQSRAPTNDASK